LESRNAALHAELAEFQSGNRQTEQLSKKLKFVIPP